MTIILARIGAIFSLDFVASFVLNYGSGALRLCKIDSTFRLVLSRSRV
jgi:hypothetical protein